MNNKNKKGAATDILLWLILSFLIVIFFAAWVFGFNRITTNLVGITDTVGTNTSIGSVAEDTFGVINFYQTAGLHLLAFVMILAMALSILVTSFLMKSHPVFLIVHLMITITAIIASAIISNVYEGLLNTGALSGTLQGFSGASFIMINLPLWTTVVGIFGAILLFAGINRDEGAGGSII